MKYEVHLHRHDTKNVKIEADNPHDALKKAKEENPGFIAQVAFEILEDPEDPEDDLGNWFEVMCHCEDCGKPIITGDEYYFWMGEDGDHYYSCKECGGANENHKPTIAD